MPVDHFSLLCSVTVSKYMKEKKIFKFLKTIKTFSLVKGPVDGKEMRMTFKVIGNIFLKKRMKKFCFNSALTICFKRIQYLMEH